MSTTSVNYLLLERCYLLFGPHRRDDIDSSSFDRYLTLLRVWHKPTNNVNAYKLTIATNKRIQRSFFMSLLRFILWVLNFTQYVTRHLLVVTALCKPLQLRHIESLCWKTIPTTITIKNVCRKICADVTRLQLCCCTYHISCLRTNKV